MSFFYSLIKLLASFFDPIWMNYYFYPMIGLAFVASVPRIFRTLFFWR